MLVRAYVAIIIIAPQTTDTWNIWSPIKFII